MALVPQLATARHWVDDDKTLVLTLHPGVHFQDGSAFSQAAFAARYDIAPGTLQDWEQGRGY